MIKTAIRNILFSGEAINPSPNSLFSPAPQWNTLTNASISADGVLSENGADAPHAILQNNPAFVLQNNIPYRWTIWVRPLARRFCYFTIFPTNSGVRTVLVFGLDGQGLLESFIGSSVSIASTIYKKIQSGIYKITINFTVSTSGATLLPIIGIVDKFPPIYSGSDATFQGLNQQSIQILANEVLAI